MAVNTLLLTSAVANQEGNQIILTFALADPGGWDYFEVQSEPTDLVAGRNSITEADIGEVSCLERTGSGTLTVTQYIDIDGALKRMVRNDTITISQAADAVLSNDGGTGTEALVAETVDTSQIGMMPNTGAADTCHLWLEAEQISIDGVADDAAIASANDDSGRSHTLTQGTGANQPLLKVSASTYYMDFDGTDDTMENATDWFHHNAYEIWAVFQPDDVTTAQGVYIKGNASANWEMGLIIEGGNLTVRHSTNGTTWAESHTICALTAGTTIVVGVAKDGATIKACVDGFWSTISAAATTSVANGTGQQRIGGGSTWGRFNGRLYAIAVYSAINTEPERAIIAHHLRYMMTSSHQPQAAGTLPTTLPYTLAQMPRKPVYVIKGYSGEYTPYESPTASDSEDRLTGQNSDWWDAGDGGAKDKTVLQLQANLEAEIDAAIALHDDYQIMMQNPGGRLQGDIMPANPWVWMTAHQMTALVNVMSSRNLGTGEDGTRRLWFYSGFGPIITTSFAYNTTAEYTRNLNGAPNNRVTPTTTPAEWVANRGNNWLAYHADWTCHFCDAAISDEPYKFIELCHSSEALAQRFRLVGEAFFEDEDLYELAPCIGLVSQSLAPWWIDNNINNGYNSTWSVDPLRTRVYFIVQNTGVFIDTSSHGAANTTSNKDMTQAQIEDFIRRGALPVAWPGTEEKVAAAWTATGNGMDVPGLVQTAGSGYNSPLGHIKHKRLAPARIYTSSRPMRLLNIIAKKMGQL
jgi:hypothetical protein